MQRLSQFLYQTRGLYPFLAMVLILALKHATSSKVSLSIYLAVLILSILLLVYRAWAAGFSATPSQGAAGSMDVLVTAGPYAHVRNPMYLLAMLLGLLFAAMSGVWYSLFIWAVGYVLIYQLVVLHEEELLQAKFGEPYVAYCKKVPRWVPVGRGMEKRNGEFRLRGETVRNVLAETIILSVFWFLSWQL